LAAGELAIEHHPGERENHLSIHAADQSAFTRPSAALA
jgi:hypothetical protein